MLVYVCLFLFPAAALAGCSFDTARLVYDAVDKNKDLSATRNEAYQLVDAVDLNQDSIMTLEEAQEVIPDYYPPLAGNEALLLEFFDVNNDGESTRSDVDRFFVKFNPNGDESISLEEFENYAKLMCGSE